MNNDVVFSERLSFKSHATVFNQACIVLTSFIGLFLNFVYTEQAVIQIILHVRHITLILTANITSCSPETHFFTLELCSHTSFQRKGDLPSFSNEFPLSSLFYELPTPLGNL